MNNMHFYKRDPHFLLHLLLFIYILYILLDLTMSAPNKSAYDGELKQIFVASQPPSVRMKSDILPRKKKQENIVDPEFIYHPTYEDILEEERLGEMELLAQLCQAEAGNQGLKGMRLVVDVVLNRVESKRFPNTIEEVIFAPGAFGVVSDGAFDRAAWHMSEDAFKAVELEMEERLDSGILYFNTEPTNGKNHYKYLDHWFSY